MKNITKRVLSMVLTLVLLLAATPQASAATTVDSGKGGENITYLLDSDGVLTLTGYGPMEDYTYNSTPWYSNRYGIKYVDLDSRITTIGAYAFSDCVALICNLTIPAGVTTIGEDAFSGCSGFTGNLTIPAGVTTIGGGAFSGCSGFTGNLTIPAGVTTIGGGAFSGCSGFTGNLIIPAGVTTIGIGAFYNCSGFTGNLTIPTGVTTIEISAFRGCSGFTGNLTIPAGVTTIGNLAFNGCSELIGNLIIPAGVTTIGDSAFSGCKGLTGNLTIPVGVTTIEPWVFNGCSGFTGNLTIPAGVTWIREWAFSGCSGFTGNLTIPSGVTSIGRDAFSGCKGLTGNLTIPARVTAIEKEAFYGCFGFTGNLTIPAGVTTIGGGAFIDCSGFTGNLTIPAGVTTIGGGAFRGCSGFTGNLTIPAGVTSIGREAFSGCKGLTGNLTIPARVTAIEKEAFYGCFGFTGNLTIPAGVTTIGGGAFIDCSGFTGNLTIPAGVTSIGREAFSGCKGLTGNLTIPVGVTTIEPWVFNGCSGFAGLNIRGAKNSIAGAPWNLPSNKIVWNAVNLAYTADGGATTTDFWADFEDWNAASLGTKALPALSEKAGYKSSLFTDTTKTTPFPTASDVLVRDTDRLLYIAYTPRSDTKYSVKHFRQDVTGAGYTLNETDALTGTTDTTATAAAKTYAKFHENMTHLNRVPTGFIAPDGSLVLSLYYDRDTFTATFDSNGGTDVPAQSGIRFQDVASTPAAPTKTGYDFTGWFADNQLTISYDFSSEVTANVTLYAKWTARADTKYSVQHFRQDVTGTGYTLFETDALTGTTDTTATAAAKTYANFHENATHISRVPTGFIAPDGSLTLALYYDRDTFTATFDSKGGTEVPAQSGIRFQDVASTPAAPTKTGYDFAGWFADNQLTISYDFSSEVTANVTLYAKWAPRADTKYSVQHFRQDVTGTGYTLFETDALTGTTDTTATAAAKTYANFHENATHISRVPTGFIAPDGSLTLALYYDRDTFTATFDSNGGSSVPAQSGIRFQDVATAPIAPTKTGYDFAGWFADAQLTISYDFAAEVTGDVTLYAKWTPRADTKYSVQHFRQDVTGAGYTLNETDALTGTTDAAATAEKKSYTGFHENATHISRVPTGFIAPDGSLVLSLYYDRDTFTATFDSKGGTEVSAQSGIRFQDVASTPAAPTKTGYDFAGWFADNQLTISYDFSSEVTANVTLYAKWTPRSDTKYSVQHFRQDVTGTGYTLFETDALTGTTDVTATAAAKTYTGFHENAVHLNRVPTGSIAPDGSLTLALYCDRDTFTATFDSKGGTEVPAQSGIRFQDVASTPAAPTKTGYDFAGWFADAQLTISYDFAAEVTGDVTLYAKWTPRADTKYSVQHFRQDVTGAGYTLNETDALTGTTDVTATAEKKSYTGFHENATHISRVPTGTIAPDGSLVLSLYYDRDTFTATFDSKGGSSVPAQSGIRFQDVASTPAAPTKTGYDFAGWFADNQLTISYDFAAEVTTNLTIYAKWTPRADTKYSVKHFRQDVTGAGYTLNETDSLTGTTDTMATAGKKSYVGFHENATHLNRVPTGTIAPDGSLTLALYYDRDTFTATFDSNGGSSVPAQSGIRFQDVASTPAAPTKTGYDFAGWFADNQLTISYDFSSEVTANVTLYAKWTPRADTKYSVQHFRQDVTGAGYTLNETDALTGTTDAAATATAKTYANFHENMTHLNRVPTGTIAPDGSLTLALYYDRDTFTATFDSKGGTEVPAQSGIRFQDVASTPAAPTKTGYDFAGWFADAQLTISYDFSSEVTGDVTLYAKWTPRADTKCSVQHFQQDVTGAGYTLNETENLTGTTDTAATAGKKTYVGFHENTTHLSRVPTGTIAPDGSLTLALYYDRDTFTATFDSKGGTEVPAQSGIRFQDVASTPAAPTKTGYDFAGWFADAQLTISYDFSSEVTGDVTLYAKWTPRADTKYSVQHFQQDVTGTGYTLFETDALTGTTDTTATAAAKTYANFHENMTHLSRVPTGTIAPDGSLVLSLYYDRDTFTATFQSNGGSSVPAQSGIRFQDVASTPAAPTKTGYDFAGWFADNQLTISYDFSSEVTANVTLYAKWTPRADTKYSVQHFRQDVTGAGYTLNETDALTGTTDAAATAEKKSYTGFHENATHISRVPTGTIAPDGSLTLALYYDRDTFTATFDSKGGTEVPAQSGIRFQDVASTPAAPTKTGYDFAGWFADEKFTVSYDFAAEVTTSLTIYAKWTARADTKYSVQHFQQDVTGTGYTLFETDALTGTTDTTATAAAKTYANFHENMTHLNRVPTGFIAPDGSLVLSLYYDRDTFTATFDSKGGTEVPAQSGIRFQDTVTAPIAPTKTGYDFAGWFADAQLTISYDFAAEVTGDVTLYAKWTARADTKYSVQHFQQNIIGTGYTLFETDALTGTTDTTATAAAKTYANFHENATHISRVPTGSIAPDGSLTLALYYDRDTFTATFDSNGGTEVPAQSGIRFQDVASTPAAPTKTGYDFAGWFADAQLTISYDFAAEVTGDVTLYAKWTARADTKYSVKHFQQNIIGTGYTLNETDALTGTTDTTATAAAKTYANFHENMTHLNRVPTGTIAPDGSLVLSLYYDRDTFTATFDSNGGSSVPAQSGIRFQDVASTPAAPTKTGYDFAGWFADNQLTISYDFSSEVTANVTLYAKWTARADTKYSVQHFRQDVTGAGYTLNETDALTGTTDVTATAAAKTYANFHENMTHLSRVPTGTIAPDGALTLALYYDRDTFTIQLDTNGGSPIDDCIIARYGSPLGALPVPARANFEFAGWYTQQNGGTKVTAETPAADIGTTSLYAQWLAEDCGIIDGTVVVDGDGNPVEGAKITIRAGNKDYKSCTTDALGTFAIFGVKYGVYNLVAEKSGTVVTTKIVLDHKTLTRTIVLPMGKTNSVVVVEDGAPEVVVGGLDSLFEDDTIYTAGDTTVVHDGGTVAIRLTVSPLDPEEGAQAAAVVLNVTVQKEVTATGALSPIITPLTELPDLMEIFIPLEKEAQGHAIYSVQRSHNGKLDTISASPNTDGEYLKVEQDILVVYAKKFSTFAISYSDPEDSGYRIRAIAGDGGAIAPGSTYVTRNRNKTFTITPGSGYRIRDVLVDGVSVGSVTTYTFEHVTAKHTIEAVFHSTACPSAKFTDVPPDTWYHDAADDLIAAGVMLGTSDKTFEPLRPLDRAQAVAMLSRLSGKAPLRSPAISFQDVAPAAWYFDTVGWSATSKVALGYGNDKFGPEDTVSREQLATMFFRYAGITPKALTVPIEGVSSWAATAMDWAVAAGILHGDDRQKLNPQGTATRAEAAVMFRQFLVLLEK